MHNPNENEQNNTKESADFAAIQEAGGFTITPCKEAVNLGQCRNLKLLKLSPAQKMQINALLQHIPSAMAAGEMSQMYTLTFPKGLPHTLMELKQGGYGTPIIGADGRISGWASLYSATVQAALYGAFTAMSVITGQFFLFQINKELKDINKHLNNIEEFLYGDKKAELIARDCFTRYAYENFPSIMAHEEQRIATISSLQQTRTVAMQDIEFYMNDLGNAASSNDKNGKPKPTSDIESDANHVLQIQKCLDLSVQLYVMSGVMEMYYAQNDEESYIKYIEKEMCGYITKCEKRMLRSLTEMHTRIRTNPTKLKNYDQTEKQFSDSVNALETQGDSPIRKSLRSVLDAATKEATYYLSSNGEVYTEKLPE